MADYAGSTSDDTYDGTPDADNAQGGGGNDTLKGNGGDDKLFGDQDSYDKTVPFGNDRLEGGEGSDILVGGLGNDNLIGGAGDDFLFGGIGFTAAGSISGASEPVGPIRYFVEYDGGNDSYDGGAGEDRAWLDYFGHTAGITLDNSNANAANAIVAGGVTIGTITGVEHIHFQGGTGNDVVTGGLLSDTLIGGDGDDVLNGGGGADLMEGGAGSDTYYVDNAGDSVIEYVVTPGIGTTVPGYDRILAGASVDLGIATRAMYAHGIEEIDAVDPAATTPLSLSGDGYVGIIRGNAGANVLSGGATLIGLGGDDTYDFSDSGKLTHVTTIVEEAGGGYDTVKYFGSVYLPANVEALIMTEPDPVNAHDSYGVGNELDNAITGNSQNNLLLGGAGGDTIHGGAGIDQLFGEDGNDSLYGDADNDYLAGGAGNDVMDGGAGGDSLYGEDGNDTLTGGSDFVFDQLVGGVGNDILHGDSGLADYDYLYGNAGDDSFYVDTGDDLTFEQPGEGTDTVYANVPGTNNGVYLYTNIENLVLLGTTAFGVGNELANTITGNASANTLLGGAGDDTIHGLGGNDILFGQADADTFVFWLNEGADVIGDFTPGTDKLDLAIPAFTDFAAVMAHTVQNGNDTAIDLGNGNLVVLQGVAKAQLSAGDFILHSASAAVVPVDHRGEAAHVGELHQLWHGSADMLIAV